jgi:hypothetical protein
MMPKTENTKTRSTAPDYTLESLIADSNEFEIWETAEWGFKGRRNYQEREFDCAVKCWKKPGILWIIALS